MSNEKEDKINQLKLLLTVSQTVVRKYIVKTCLPLYGGNIQNVLNSNKHNLFHLHYNMTPCCKCDLGDPQLHRDCQIQYYYQFEKLYNRDGKGKHEQIEKPTWRGKPVVTMHCLCNLNGTSSLDLLDLPLMVIVLKNCFKQEYDTHVKMWITTLIEVRNFVSHIGSVNAYSVPEFNAKIQSLDYAMMKIADLVTLSEGGYKKNVRRKIDDIKTHRREESVITQEMERNQDVISPLHYVNRLDHIPEEMANANKKLDVVIKKSENLLIKVQDLQQCQLNSESRIVKEIGQMKTQHHDDISLLKIDIQSLSSNHRLHKEAADKDTELLETQRENQELKKRIIELEGEKNN